MTTDVTTQPSQILSIKYRNNKLPAEVLTQVISLATQMHEQDEFSDQSPSISFTEPSRLLSEPQISLYARNEEKNVLRDRLSFVQVIEALGRNPSYGPFVRRVQLDAVWAELMSDETDNRTSCAISWWLPKFSLLGKLRRFQTSYSYCQGDSFLLIDSTSHYSYTYCWEGGSHFWNNVQSLDIDLDNATFLNSTESPTIVLFPRLISLRVRSGDDRAILEDIEQNWRAPALQTLSLHFEYIDMWYILVNWAKETLTTLHLCTESLPDSEPIHLPKLETLVIQECMRSDWAELIIAPNVATLVFGDNVNFFQYGGFFAQVFTKMIANYPSCSKVFCGQRSYCFYISGDGARI
ncbi:hypothetical protein CPB86DRAFT_798295 [Serendipita vermifera]|nr:hypothetical protein CPB86DRAFT_798295 [Serendipita vermifera]